MAETGPTYADWPTLFARPDWETLYRDGAWFDWPSEVPHHGVVAGFASRLVGRGTLLDAGCGNGGLLDYLDLARFRYVGFDFSPQAVAAARQRLPGGAIAEANFDDFRPAPGDRFDVIVFNESLQFVPDPLAVLDRYRGFLTTTGVAIVSLFQAPSETANGVLLGRFLRQTCDAGRFRLREWAEARNLLRDLTWQIFVLE